MDNFAHTRLEKLAGDLGFQRSLRFLGLIMLGLLTIWFAIWLSRMAHDKPIPDWLSTGSTITGVMLVIVAMLMAVNFDKIKETQADLQELMKQAEQQAGLLALLKPMVADAFRLDPDRIRPALVERLIESVIDELRNDKSAASRTFLQRQPEAVKDLVRSRSTAILQSRQIELGLHLHAASQEGRLVPLHEIELLVDAMAKAHDVLRLIPDQLPDEQIPMPAGARIVPEMPPHHVADAHS